MPLRKAVCSFFYAVWIKEVYMEAGESKAEGGFAYFKGVHRNQRQGLLKVKTPFTKKVIGLGCDYPPSQLGICDQVTL